MSAHRFSLFNPPTYDCIDWYIDNSTETASIEHNVEAERKFILQLFFWIGKLSGKLKITIRTRINKALLTKSSMDRSGLKGELKTINGNWSIWPQRWIKDLPWTTAHGTACYTTNRKKRPHAESRGGVLPQVWLHDRSSVTSSTLRISRDIDLTHCCMCAQHNPLDVTWLPFP